MLKVALLISGSGSTAEAVIKACQSGKLNNVNPCIVIASKEDAGGIEKVLKLGVKTEVVRLKDYKTREIFGQKLIEICKENSIDLVSQNGWLPLTPENIIAEYKNNIINQHPGPLDGRRPDFGGKGMYGSRVICARIAYCWLTQSDYWIESTVHHLNEKFDEGKVIRVERIGIPKLNKTYTIDTLEKGLLIKTTEKVQKKLLPLEHKNVIEAIKAFSDNNVPTYIRKRPLIPDNNFHVLKNAKELAIMLFPEG